MLCPSTSLRTNVKVLSVPELTAIEFPMLPNMLTFRKSRVP